MPDETHAQCHYHEWRLASARCVSCGLALCRECAQNERGGGTVCRVCAIERGVKQKRSPGVSFFAFFNIVVVGLVAGSVIAGLALEGPESLFSYHGSAPEYQMLLAYAYVAAAALLVPAGVGLLGLREYARIGTLLAAWLLIIIIAADAVLQVTRVVPQRGFNIASLVSLVYPVILVTFFTRPMVKVQFARRLKQGVAELRDNPAARPE